MKNNLSKFFILLLPILLFLSSCSDFRKAVGREKLIPDEYSVALTPSLIVPPGYRIDPELIISNSKQVLNQNKNLSDRLNVKDKKESNASKSFMELFGSKTIPKNIRRIVDEETLGIALSERTGLNILFGDVPQTGIVIDAKKESLRIRNNKISGEKNDKNASPAYDINSGSTLLIK